MKRRRVTPLRRDKNTRRLWLTAAVFLVATVLVYFPAWSGKPIWDDDGHLTRPELQTLQGLARIWFVPGATQQYYPLVHTVFWLQHKLWGDALLPYHLLNILLHGLSAFLLFRILGRLKIPGALLAAAIFALHPVQVESIAWISELKNTLSGFLFLLAGWSYLRFDEERNRRFYFLALGLFLCGLLAKSVVATLPVALLVVLWWKRGRLKLKRDLPPLLPFFALGIIAGLFTIWVEHHYIGARGEDFNLSPLARVLLAGRIFWFYLAKLFWPQNLTFIYPRWEMDAGIWWQYLFPLALAGVLLALWKIRDRSRAPLAAVLFFLAALFPALGFINVFPFLYSFVADHFQYLASIGIITLSAAAIMWTLTLFRVPFFCSIALPFILAFLTWRQAHMYADGETLYRTTLARNSGCWMAHNNLANILMRSGSIPEAITHYDQALRLRPRYVEAHYNLGHALLQTGEVDGAIAQCQAALAIDPKSAEAHSNLANAIVRKHEFLEALKHYEEALRIAPNSVAFQINLASFLATSGDPELRDGPRAVELAGKAVRLTNEDNTIALHVLGSAYAEAGDLPRALATTEKALRLAEARRDEGMIRAAQKQIARLRSSASAQN